MIGCDWLNTLEEFLLLSADDRSCASTVVYGESLWFHLFHIHEPNGWFCVIHEQIRRSKRAAHAAPRRMKKPNPAVKIQTRFVFLDEIKSPLCRWPQCGYRSSACFGVLNELSVSYEQKWSGMWSLFLKQEIWCILYTVQEGESQTLVRDRLCSAPLISWLTSSRVRAKKRVQPSWALFLKRALRSLCRGHIYDPKLRRRVWAPSKTSGPCVLLEHIWKKAQRCVEAPRDTSARVHVCVNTVRDERNPCWPLDLRHRQGWRRWQ